MNWKNIASKALHSLLPAAGAALAALIPGLGIPLAAKVALGAAVGYLVKRPRTPKVEELNLAYSEDEH